MTLGAVVLCGGQSRRMGADKAWLPFGPEVLLQRVVRLVGEAVGPVVVVAAEGQNLPALPESVRIIRDPIADRGPLVGLGAGLAALTGLAELAYATSTDAPFLAPGWVGHLAGLIGDHDAAVVHAGGFPHPLAAVYRIATVGPAIERLAQQGRSSLRDLLGDVRTLAVPGLAMEGVDPGLATLRNLNTSDNYRDAMRELGLDPAGLAGGSAP